MWMRYVVTTYTIYTSIRVYYKLIFFFATFVFRQSFMNKQKSTTTGVAEEVPNLDDTCVAGTTKRRVSRDHPIRNCRAEGNQTRSPEHLRLVKYTARCARHAACDSFAQRKTARPGNERIIRLVTATNSLRFWSSFALKRSNNQHLYNGGENMSKNTILAAFRQSRHGGNPHATMEEILTRPVLQHGGNPHAIEMDCEDFLHGATNVQYENLRLTRVKKVISNKK